MRKAEIRPTETRVVGNVLSNFDEIIEENEFENYHILNTLNGTMEWQGKTKTFRRLESSEENLTLTAAITKNIIDPSGSSDTENNYSRITVKCQDENQNLIGGHKVYIYEHNVLLATLTTNTSGTNLGKASWDFKTNISGTHTLRITTKKQNGFNPATQYKTITVREPVYLSIIPTTLSLEHGEQQLLTVQANNTEGDPINDTEITLYEGIRELTTDTTDDEGKITYLYSESENRGKHTKIQVTSTLWYRGETSTITGKLTRRDGTPLSNKTIELIQANQAKTVATATTNSSGTFNIEYVPTLTTSNYYLVFYSTVEDTTNNEYQEYEPCLHDLGKLTSTIPRINMTWLLNKTSDTILNIEDEYPTITGGNSKLQLFQEKDYYLDGTKKTTTPITILSENYDSSTNKKHLQFALGINSLDVDNIDVIVTKQINNGTEEDISSGLFNNGIDRFHPYYLEHELPANTSGTVLFNFYLTGTQGIFQEDPTKGYGLKFTLKLEYKTS